jgi:peptide/nickel transport system ATP-binding protein
LSALARPPVVMQQHSRALLDVQGLKIASRIGGVTRTIVADLHLSLAPGETIGIVGESGSGKSMTARALIGLLPQGVFARGEVTYEGRNLLSLSERQLAGLRGTEIGMILQDPFTMLNPLMRCGHHIDEMLRDERGRPLSSAARQAEAVRRLQEVGITDPGVVDRYPFQLSGGMRQRVAIAAALARDPKVLIADEPSTALDVTTQREILSLLKSLQDSRGMGLVLITHDLRVAFSMCDRIYVLYAGSLLETGPASALEQEPMHPYTLGLLLSEPPGDRRLSRLVAIGGSVPPPDDVADRCAFSPRCVWAQSKCSAARPELAGVELGRQTACIRVGEIRGEMAEARRLAELEAHVAAESRIAKPLVRVTSMVKAFEISGQGTTRTVRAVGGVSLEIGANESVGLVGESGSGKTTIGRCLVGLETPNSGQITIDGVDASDFARLSGQDRRRLRQTIQIIFQDPYSSLNPVRSVGSTLKEALALRHPRGANYDALMLDLLKRVGLPSTYAGRKPVALSGGERQRVAIARALAVEPRILVCDEAVSALDVSVQAQILNLFKTLRSELGMSYLFITHNLAVVRQVVERVYVLYRGEVVEEGPVDEVLDHPKHWYTARLVDSVPRSDSDWLRSAAR